MALVFEQPAVMKDMVIGILSCLAIFIISISFPLLGFFVILFLPFPVLFYRLKQGRNTGATIVAVSVGIMFVLVSGLSIDILFCGALLLSGFFLGECIEKHLGIEKILIYTCLATVGICMAVIAVYAASSGKGIFELISEYMSRNLELTMALYQEMGVDSEKIDQFKAALPRVHYILTRVLPAIVTVMMISVIWINILIIKKVLARKEIQVKSLEHLNTWKAPEYLVWVTIGLGILLFVPHTGIKLFGLNAILMLMLVYFFQGIAIVSFFFKRKGFPLILRLFFYCIITIQTIFLLIVVLLGFFDTWFNFRKLDAIGNSPNKILP